MIRGFNPLADALRGISSHDNGMIPDGQGGLVPVTNSRFDPSSGDFISPLFGQGQVVGQGFGDDHGIVARPQPAPPMAPHNEALPGDMPRAQGLQQIAQMTPYQQALKHQYDIAYKAWEAADRRVQAAAEQDPRVGAIYQHGADEARKMADHYVDGFIETLKPRDHRDWHPQKVSPGDHVYNPDTGRYEVPVPAEPAPRKSELKEVGVDPYTGEKKFRRFYEGEDPQTPPQGDAGSSSGLLAKGVMSIDDTLAGDAYIKQFSPTARAEIEAYMDGRTMPTGNPRSGHVQSIKAAAAKFASDTGQQADDTTFAARKQMRTQLSSAQPNSLGGQINTGNTALDHLSDVAASAAALNNTGGWGFAPLAHAINAARGLGTEQAARMAALKDAAHHYGQEITKFYAGSPGGEQERLSFETSIDGTKSPQELAAVIAQEMTLMRGRLAAVGSQIQGVLGDRGMAQYPVVQPGGKDGIDRLNKILPLLAGGEAAQSASPHAQAPPRITGDDGYNALPSGARYTAPDGSIRTKR